MGSTLKHIVELVGPEAAKALCRAYGGVSHYIPLEAKPTHGFADVVGLVAWKKICQHYGGGSLVLPKGEAHFKREMALHLLNTTGLSIRQIAIKAGCTERFVSRLSGEIYKKAQTDLPFGAADA